jgi:hypothetical protein
MLHQTVSPILVVPRSSKVGRRVDITEVAAGCCSERCAPAAVAAVVRISHSSAHKRAWSAHSSHTGEAHLTCISCKMSVPKLLQSSMTPILCELRTKSTGMSATAAVEIGLTLQPCASPLSSGDRHYGIGRVGGIYVRWVHTSFNEDIDCLNHFPVAYRRNWSCCSC